jgi:hypothetical protein
MEGGSRQGRQLIYKLMGAQDGDTDLVVHIFVLFMLSSRVE